jgi:hypothetical protein
MPEDVVVYAKELEAWIDQGVNEADKGTRFEALMLAYQKFGPAGIEGALTDCAQVIYDYISLVEAAPPAPSAPETSQESGEDSEKAEESEKPEPVKAETSEFDPPTAVRPKRGRRPRSGRAG